MPEQWTGRPFLRIILSLVSERTQNSEGMHVKLLAIIDARLSEFSTKLRDDLAIEPPSSLKLATTIYDEIRTLPVELLPTLAGESPLSLKDRYDELMSTLKWWSTQCTEQTNMYAICRILNYFCFVYLSESCFKVLREKLPPDSITRKCCKYLTDNPVRAFRNAVAHANWRPTLDESAIDFGRGKAPTQRRQCHGSGSRSMI